MTTRPPGRVTRTTSLATSNGLGANIAPKMLTTRSKESSSRPSRFEASPSWNRQLARPSACALRFPASTRLLAMSTPSTSAPSRAAGNAVVPSPQPRSRTFISWPTPMLSTSDSPLSRMLAAIRVKSPFSQSALFGFILLLPGRLDSTAQRFGDRLDANRPGRHGRAMQTVFLLRHAKSSWADSTLSDIERPLAPRGERAAQKIAAYVRKRKIRPTLVLCSPSVRTRRTLEAIRPSLGKKCAVEFRSALYGASSEELLRQLQALHDSVASAMLVGHNP